MRYRMIMIHAHATPGRRFRRIVVRPHALGWREGLRFFVGAYLVALAIFMALIA